MEKTKIVNGFRMSLNKAKNPKDTRIEHFEFRGEPIYQRGFFRIFCDITSYVVTYKNIAVSQLVGCNKELVDQLHENNPPAEYGPQRFLFDRAKENMEKYKEHIILEDKSWMRFFKKNK